jgi:hypothetical protein
VMSAIRQPARTMNSGETRRAVADMGIFRCSRPQG